MKFFYARHTAVALCLCIAFFFSCSVRKLPNEISGRILVKMGYDDYVITLSNGIAEISSLQIPEVVRNGYSSGGVFYYQRNSMSDDLSRFVYVEGASKVWLYDSSANMKRLILSSTSDAFCFSPIISPNGRYACVVEEDESQKPRSWGEYIIDIVDLDMMQIDQLKFENNLRGPNIIVPGLVRWLNDSSGFTYTRTHAKTPDQHDNLSSEICLYDVEKKSSEVVGMGAGGMLSPQKDKLLWINAENLKELKVTYLGKSETFQYRATYNIIDYTWSPDGKHILIVTDGLMGGRIIIADDRLRRKYVAIGRGPSMESWDIYFVPVRWLPLKNEKRDEKQEGGRFTH